jgi:hypothetical protein
MRDYWRPQMATAPFSGIVVKIDYVIGGAGITLFRSMDYFVRSTTLHVGTYAVSPILPA